MEEKVWILMATMALLLCSCTSITGDMGNAQAVDTEKGVEAINRQESTRESPLPATSGEDWNQHSSRISLKNTLVAFRAFDVDRDGDTDLFAIGREDQKNFTLQSFLRRGRGGGAEEASQEWDMAVSVLEAPFQLQTQPMIADLNGDGMPDLVFVAQNGAKVLSAIHHSDGIWATTLHEIRPQGTLVAQVISDANGDGMEDLMLVWCADHLCQIETLLSNGKRLVPVGRSQLPEGLTTSVQAFSGDLDGDGKVDVVLLGQVNESWTVLTAVSRSKGRWEVSVDGLKGAAGMLLGAHLAMTKEGQALLVLATETSEVSGLVYRRGKAGAWIPLARSALGDFDEQPYVAVEDFDGDDLPDIVLASWKGEGIIKLTMAQGEEDGFRLRKPALVKTDIAAREAQFEVGRSIRSRGAEIQILGKDLQNLKDYHFVRLSTSLLPQLRGLDQHVPRPTWLLYSQLVDPECEALGYTEPFVPSAGSGTGGAFEENTTYTYSLCYHCPAGIGFCGWRFRVDKPNVLTIVPNERFVGPDITDVGDSAFVFHDIEQDTIVNVSGDVLRYDTVPWTTFATYQLFVQAEPPPTPPTTPSGSTPPTTPSGPHLSVSRTLIDFGNVERDFDDTLATNTRLMVSNTGQSGDLQFTVSLVSDLIDFNFYRGGASVKDDILSPGESLEMSFTFTNITSIVNQQCPLDPADANYRICTETAIISGAGSTIPIVLRARVAKPSHLEINGIDARSTSEITIDLGEVTLDGQLTYDLTLQAAGGVTDLVVSAGGSTTDHSSAPWTVTTNIPDGCESHLHGRLAPNEFCKVRVIFDPLYDRALGGTWYHKYIHFRSYLASYVSGDAEVRFIARVAPSPKLRLLSPATSPLNPVLDFGQLSPGESWVETVVIDNDGDPGSRLIGTASIVGPSAFSTSPSPFSFDLGKGEEASIPVTYAPSTFGDHVSRLRLNHNDVVENHVSLIPDPLLVGEANRVRLLVRTFVPWPQYRIPGTQTCLLGDNRWYSASSGSSRTTQILEFNLKSGEMLVNEREAGYSQQIICGSVPRLDEPYHPPITVGPPVQGTLDCLSQSVSVSEDEIQATFSVTCPDPAAPGLPDLDMSLIVTVRQDNKVVTVSGSHDAFPAYEVWYQINGGSPQQAYGHEPGAQYNESNLSWPQEISVP